MKYPNIIALTKINSMMTGVAYFYRKGNELTAVYTDNSRESATFKDTIEVFKNADIKVDVFALVNRLQSKARGEYQYKTLYGED